MDDELTTVQEWTEADRQEVGARRVVSAVESLDLVERQVVDRLIGWAQLLQGRGDLSTADADLYQALVGFYDDLDLVPTGVCRHCERVVELRPYEGLRAWLHADSAVRACAPPAHMLAEPKDGPLTLEAPTAN